MSRTWLVGLATLGAVGAMLILASPLTRLGLFGSEGHIIHGRFLDVEIGEPATSAGQKMQRRGFKLIEVSNGGNCMGRTHPKSVRVELYFDDSWRRGTICLGSRQGRVVAIDWFYDFAAP